MPLSQASCIIERVCSCMASWRGLWCAWNELIDLGTVIICVHFRAQLQ
jgi:hypothetical protein